MIEIRKGNLLQSKAIAIVNAVNTVGVMGKGIALQFKEAFPHNYNLYVDACTKNELTPGKLLAVFDQSPRFGRKIIINFPTKVHGRNPSEYTYIEKGLIALRLLLLQEKNIESIAIPALGCGNGGLDWNIVKQMIEKSLIGLETKIFIFAPDSHYQ